MRLRRPGRWIITSPACGARLSATRTSRAGSRPCMAWDTSWICLVKNNRRERRERKAATKLAELNGLNEEDVNDERSFRKWVLVVRSVPPHPSPLPQGEGAPCPLFQQSGALSFSSDGMRFSLSPEREGEERVRSYVSRDLLGA